MAPSGFDLFRPKGQPSYYESQQVAAIGDKQSLAILFACLIAVIACFVFILGTHGKERFAFFVRFFNVSVVGVAIIVAIYGNNWQIGTVRSKCPYTFLPVPMVTAEVSVHVGLTGVNISMFVNETSKGKVNFYNERYDWNEKPISDLGEEFQRAMLKGLPSPILKVYSYFTVDTGQMRWGRHLRASGYYACSLLWTAFSFWILATVLNYMVVLYSSSWAVLTGGLLALVALLYHLMQAWLPLRIPLEEGSLTLAYGWNFWLVVATSGWATLMGLIMLLLDLWAPEEIRYFLDIQWDNEETGDDDCMKDNYELTSRSDAAHKVHHGYVNRGFDPDEKSYTRHRLSSNNDEQLRYERMKRSLSDGNVLRRSGATIAPDLDIINQYDDTSSNNNTITNCSAPPNEGKIEEHTVADTDELNRL